MENKLAVNVLVEHSTRLMLLCKMADTSAESALAAFTIKLRQIVVPLRQMLTYDQGKKIACHRELAKTTEVRVCGPHSPYAKGLLENTNGLLQALLLKGTGLSVRDQQALDEIAGLINTRPRQMLVWLTPNQAFKQCMDAIE
ncbi:MAG: IS30 family transposase [Burkholderiaceae bacterium]|nr:IS30 family transposase [Burkholderiaceae bacterium]